MKPKEFIPELSEKEMDIFWRSVVKTDGCWERSGSTVSIGYTRIHLSGSNFLSHRVSWFLQNGQIPKDMQILHSCDNPRCVRPEHLFLGSQLDNVLDMLRKGRANSATGLRNGRYTKPEKTSRGLNHYNHIHPEKRHWGERNGSAKLKEEDVRKIREVYFSGGISQSEIARRYKMRPASIRNIIMRFTWDHVKP